jgi:uncharacterized membrane protein
MILAMLLWWIGKGKPHLASMDANQHIAYISDVGASELKPLFIAMSTVTVVVFDLGFIAERWLRHRGRLARNTSRNQKALSILAIIFSVVGGAGLILLTIFDALRHHNLHDTFLGVFIGGYVISAIFICVEYQRLGIHFRQFKILRASFWIKLCFILTEIALAIAFGVTQRTSHYNVGAILEWVIALVFTFYVLSFFVDFIPAVRTKHHQSRTTAEEMATAEASSQQHMPEDRDADRYGATTNGYTNRYTGGYAGGRHYAQAQQGNGHMRTNGYAHSNGFPIGHSKLEDDAPRAGQAF